MLPEPFTDFATAKWRSALPVREAWPIMRDGRLQVAALSFDTPAGVVRLIFDEADAVAVAGALQAVLADFHSRNSSGMPSSDVSPNDGQEQPPVAISAAAVSARA